MIILLLIPLLSCKSKKSNGFTQTNRDTNNLPSSEKAAANEKAFNLRDMVGIEAAPILPFKAVQNLEIEDLKVYLESDGSKTVIEISGTEDIMADNVFYQVYAIDEKRLLRQGSFLAVEAQIDDLSQGDYWVYARSCVRQDRVINLNSISDDLQAKHRIRTETRELYCGKNYKKRIHFRSLSDATSERLQDKEIIKLNQENEILAQALVHASAELLKLAPSPDKSSDGEANSDPLLQAAETFYASGPDLIRDIADSDILDSHLYEFAQYLKETDGQKSLQLQGGDSSDIVNTYDDILYGDLYNEANKTEDQKKKDHNKKKVFDNLATVLLASVGITSLGFATWNFYKRYITEIRADGYLKETNGKLAETKKQIDSGKLEQYEIDEARQRLQSLQQRMSELNGKKNGYQGKSPDGKVVQVQGDPNATVKRRGGKAIIIFGGIIGILGTASAAVAIVKKVKDDDKKLGLTANQDEAYTRARQIFLNTFRDTAQRIIENRRKMLKLRGF